MAAVITRVGSTRDQEHQGELKPALTALPLERVSVEDELHSCLDV